MSETLNLGLGLRRVIYTLVIIFMFLMIACLILSFIFSYDFLAGFFALTPGVTIMLLNSFIYIEGGHFIIRRLFRRDIVIEVNQFNQVSRAYFSVPGIVILKIEFVNGQRFYFLSNGKAVNQLRSEITAVVGRQTN